MLYCDLLQAVPATNISDNNNTGISIYVATPEVNIPDSDDIAAANVVASINSVSAQPMAVDVAIKPSQGCCLKLALCQVPTSPMANS